MSRYFKAGLELAIGTLAIPFAWLPASVRPADRLAAAVGQMLIIGFYGSTTRSPFARLLAAQMRAGQVGGVFFVSQNIGRRDKVAALVRLFRNAETEPLIAIDHEGGIVQRLTAAHGFTSLPCAREIAATMTPIEARGLYAKAGRELFDFGFNVNLGPVADFDDPNNSAVGAFGRAYGVEPDRIAAYAAAFVEGFAEAGVLCAIKHFPGHGRSVGDSHFGPADISEVWSEAELLPFQQLIASGHARMVMGGHLRLASLEPEPIPTTVSAPVITGLLRDKLGFEGVAVTDDLDMDAISRTMDRREAVIRAIAAGNDLLIIKNLFAYDPFLPRKAVAWVRAAIAKGALSEQQVFGAAARISAMRQTISGRT